MTKKPSVTCICTVVYHPYLQQQKNDNNNNNSNFKNTLLADYIINYF